MAMRQFDNGSFQAAPLDMANVDTDQIIPARFLKRPRDDRYPSYLFHDLRFDGEGRERSDFILNRIPWRDTQVIVADRNFGCGSSREGAVYALADAGFRAVIAPSFGDIFYSNAMKNGFLPIRLPTDVCSSLRQSLAEGQGGEIGIDLEAQSITGPDGAVHQFEISAFHKHCLLNGLDDIGFTMEQQDAIKAADSKRETDMPWLTKASV